ncbi:unnamed protein product [Calicophoron daubneyi]|uniref:Uncharacterized protein n=1 Tax=Calicophoron daubneyi TaxID=300641 RepID=A0AAV2T3V5_CALDB
MSNFYPYGRSRLWCKFSSPATSSDDTDIAKFAISTPSPEEAGGDDLLHHLIKMHQNKLNVRRAEPLFPYGMNHKGNSVLGPTRQSQHESWMPFIVGREGQFFHKTRTQHPAIYTIPKADIHKKLTENLKCLEIKHVEGMKQASESKKTSKKVATTRSSALRQKMNQSKKSSRQRTSESKSTGRPTYNSMNRSSRHRRMTRFVAVTVDRKRGERGIEFSAENLPSGRAVVSTSIGSFLYRVNIPMDLRFMLSLPYQVIGKNRRTHRRILTHASYGWPTAESQPVTGLNFMVHAPEKSDASVCPFECFTPITSESIDTYGAQPAKFTHTPPSFHWCVILRCSACIVGSRTVLCSHPVQTTETRILQFGLSTLEITYTSEESGPIFHACRLDVFEFYGSGIPNHICPKIQREYIIFPNLEKASVLLPLGQLERRWALGENSTENAMCVFGISEISPNFTIPVQQNLAKSKHCPVFDTVSVHTLQSEHDAMGPSHSKLKPKVFIEDFKCSAYPYEAHNPLPPCQPSYGYGDAFSSTTNNFQQYTNFSRTTDSSVYPISYSSVGYKGVPFNGEGTSSACSSIRSSCATPNLLTADNSDYTPNYLNKRTAGGHVDPKRSVLRWDSTKYSPVPSPVSSVSLGLDSYESYATSVMSTSPGFL